jgi:hypothetical protein
MSHKLQVNPGSCRRKWGLKPVLNVEKNRELSHLVPLFLLFRREFKNVGEESDLEVINFCTHPPSVMVSTWHLEAEPNDSPTQSDDQQLQQLLLILSWPGLLFKLLLCSGKHRLCNALKLLVQTTDIKQN